MWTWTSYRGKSGWAFMWIVFHCQTYRKANLEIKDEKVRIETETLELQERRAARKKLQEEQMRAQEAETARWIQAEEAKTERARRKRLERENTEDPADTTSIWMTSPQGHSTPKLGQCSRCQGRNLESIV